VYGVVRDSLNGFTVSQRRDRSTVWVYMRHAESAAFAAGAEAHLTGQFAVCCGKCGPGNLHLINGLFDYHRSGVPARCCALLSLVRAVKCSSFKFELMGAAH
jgi:pyruvate dehydrogenase (quinone)